MNENSDVNGRLAFNVGSYTPSVTIDNVFLKVLDPTITTYRGASLKNSFVKVLRTDKRVKIQVLAPESGKISCKLYNLKGNLIESADIEKRFENIYSHSFDLSNKAEGFYIVKVEKRGMCVHTSKIYFTK